MIDALTARLELYARISEARAAWLEVERAASGEPDSELDNRIAIARYAILDTSDRVAQLLETPL